MKKLFFVSCVTVFIAGQFGSASASEKIRWVGTVDYYFSGDINKGLKNDLTESVNDLNSFLIDASGANEKSNGIGAHLGFMCPTSNKNLEIGSSVSVIMGPKFKGKLDDRDIVDPGTLTNEVKMSYLNLLGQAAATVPLNNALAGRLTVGAGVGQAKLNQKRTGTGFYVDDGFDVSAKKTAFIFEVAPSLVFNFSKVSAELGFRYSHLPKFDRTLEHIDVSWNPYSIFAGLNF